MQVFINVILAILCLNAADVDQGRYLTNSSSKTWYLQQVSPTSNCKSMDLIARDNTYTFFADDRFEFDHGQVTEDPDCNGEGCCSDWVNLEGTWAFTNNGKGLKIIALRIKGTSESLDNEVLFNASIDLLSEDILRLRIVDPETKITHSLEFRKK